MAKLEEYDCVNVDGKLYSLNGIDLIKEHSESLGFVDLERPSRSCVGVHCSLKELYEALRIGGKTNYLLVKNVIINCEKVNEMSITSTRDDETDELGFSLNITLRGKGKFAYRREEIFFNTHIEAERYYEAIDRILARIEDKKLTI